MSARKGVSAVGVFDRQGRMLWGKRRDNGKWTTPAGHLEPGESPHAGAIRELFEESGLYPAEPLVKVATGKGGPDNELDVYAFTTIAEGKPTTVHDPDEEIAGGWKWIDVSKGLPEEIRKNLHVPESKNLLLRLKPLKHTPDGNLHTLRELSRLEA
jgi:8-oxo-dGTP pyrophosphatase MutT (NUDIX family)